MQQSLIFTEGFGCGKIVDIALTSFHKHHDLKVFVFGTSDDFTSITPHPNNILLDCSNIQELRNLYLTGHAGTAYIFARVYSGNMREFDNCITQEYDKSLLDCTHVIHFDSDIYFKKESISLIEKEFDIGYHIIGSRRCYTNNPANIPVDPSIPDSTSTYFFGMDISIIPKYDIVQFASMCQGGFNPLGHMVFDFFDPVTFVALKNGAKIKFIDQEKVGGQNENGKKHSSFKSNMHMDVGENLAHFGGVGSGYAYHLNKAKQNPSYGKWALGRWGIFAKIFYFDNFDYGPPIYGDDGRWINGGYDDELLNIIQSDI